MNIGTKNRTSRRGAIIVYVVLILPAMVGIVSLAVDVGHVAVVKEELRRAAIAAAQYGAAGLATDAATAQSWAALAAADNKSDGASIALTASDVQVGTWDSNANTFSNTGSGTAIKVTVTRAASRSTGVALTFGAVLGFKTLDVSASCTAVYLPASSSTATVLGTADPYLTDAIDGANASGDDYAGGLNGTVDCRPAAIGKINVVPGQTIQLTNTSGTVAHDPTDPQTSALGDTSYILGHDAGAQNGISNIIAPINSMIAIFYGPTLAANNTAPATLDFTSQASRDYTTISPLLQQAFYVGTGKNSLNQQQSIVVPAGATNMVLAPMDGFEWMNNQGKFTTTVTSKGSVVLVQ